jgi:hypothetical protein
MNLELEKAGLTSKDMKAKTLMNAFHKRMNDGVGITHNFRRK